MAKTPRRRSAPRPQGSLSASAAATRNKRSGSGGDDRRPPSTATGPSLGAPPPRPTTRRRNPFGWFSRLQPRFVADVIAELRKVTWPTFSDTRYLTFVVATVALLVGIILGLFDLAFGWAIEQIFFN